MGGWDSGSPTVSRVGVSVISRYPVSGFPVGAVGIGPGVSGRGVVSIAGISVPVRESAVATAEPGPGVPGSSRHARS